MVIKYIDKLGNIPLDTRYHVWLGREPLFDDVVLCLPTYFFTFLTSSELSNINQQFGREATTGSHSDQRLVCLRMDNTSSSSSTQQSAKAPSRGLLPGFLRRTFTTWEVNDDEYGEEDEDNDDDDDDDVNSSSNSPWSSAPSSDEEDRNTTLTVNRGSGGRKGEVFTTTNNHRAGDDVDNDDDGTRSAMNIGLMKISDVDIITSTNNTKGGINGDGGGLGKTMTSTIRSPRPASLRAVAFPPLPSNSIESHNQLEGGLEETNEEELSSSSAAAKFSPSSTPSLSFPPPQSSSTTTTTMSTTTKVVGNANIVVISSKKKTYREIQFDTMLALPIVSLRELRKLAWNGIPTYHRPTVWKILVGYLPTNVSRRETTLKRRRSEYADAVRRHYDIPDDSRTNSEQETLRQVLVDVPRTAPDVPLFRNRRVRRCLGRLLYVWATRHPASGYVQGINDIVTPLLAVFIGEYLGDSGGGVDSNSGGNNSNSNCSSSTTNNNNIIDECLNGTRVDELSDEILENIEADVYWCLTSLLSGIQDHYTSDQPGMQRMVMRLEELVNRIDADLAAHLHDTGIEFMQFAFKWMNCLLLREFKLPCVMRLWDAYLSEGEGGFEDFHVYVCASFLVHFSSTLRQMGFDQLFQFMQVSTHE